MNRPIDVLQLDHRDRTTLERWVRARTTPQRLAMRSLIVLLLAEGLSRRRIAHAPGVSRHTVDLWAASFREGGPQALVKDKPGRGRRPGKGDSATNR